MKTLSPSVQLIMPAVLHLAEASGRLADTVTSDGKSARLRVDRDLTSQAPLFTASAPPEETIGSGVDIERMVVELKLDPGLVLWKTFCTGDGWGLPPSGMAPASQSMQLPVCDPALGVCELLDSAFGLVLSSSLSLGEFCIGLAGITATEADANELAHALSQGAPTFLRTSGESLLSQIERVLSRSITGSESAVKAMYIAISKMPLWLLLSPFYFAGAAVRSLVLEQAGLNGDVFPPLVLAAPPGPTPGKPSGNLRDRPPSRPPSPGLGRPPPERFLCPPRPPLMACRPMSFGDWYAACKRLAAPPSPSHTRLHLGLVWPPHHLVSQR